MSSDAASAFFGRLETGGLPFPVYFPNDPRDPLTTGGKDGWIYAELGVADEGPAELGEDGSRLHREDGETEVIVYVPTGTKVARAIEVATLVRDLFGVNALRDADVTIESRIIGRGSSVNGPAGRWYAVPVVISWWQYRTE